MREVGAKAANLGELCSLDLNIPKGFVVPTAVRDEFLERLSREFDLNPCEPSPKDSSIEADSFADVFRETPLGTQITDALDTFFESLDTDLVSVRSSGTLEDSSRMAFAGIFESYLGITKSGLPDAVKKCWYSPFSKRAHNYFQQHSLCAREMGLAVIIQQMVFADAAGICFTSNPITNEAGQYYIEAAWGLGDAVVSGKITPDCYIVDAANGQIADITVNRQERMSAIVGDSRVDLNVDSNLQDKQKLTDTTIAELVHGCRKIHSHFKFPQDIEFAVKDDVLYFLQARPISTIEISSSKDRG